MAQAHLQAHPVAIATGSVVSPTSFLVWAFQIGKIVVTVAIFAAATFAISGWFAGGRWGFSGVKGGSMDPTLPQGSVVVVLPLPAREGDVVVAYGSLQNPDDADDSSEGLMIKRLRGKILVSDSPSGCQSTSFQVRGRVVSPPIPIQRLLPSRRGAEAATLGPIPESERLDAVAEAKSRKIVQESSARAVKATGNALSIAEVNSSNGIDLGRTGRWSVLVDGCENGAPVAGVEISNDRRQWRLVGLNAGTGRFSGRYLRYQPPASTPGRVLNAWATAVEAEEVARLP
jgi:hypothetical protein